VQGTTPRRQWCSGKPGVGWIYRFRAAMLDTAVEARRRAREKLARRKRVGDLLRHHHKFVEVSIEASGQDAAGSHSLVVLGHFLSFTRLNHHSRDRHSRFADWCVGALRWASRSTLSTLFALVPATVCGGRCDHRWSGIAAKMLEQGLPPQCGSV